MSELRKRVSQTEFFLIFRLCLLHFKLTTINCENQGKLASNEINIDIALPGAMHSNDYATANDFDDADDTDVDAHHTYKRR